jgi:hypothetical protein
MGARVVATDVRRRRERLIDSRRRRSTSTCWCSRAERLCAFGLNASRFQNMIDLNLKSAFVRHSGRRRMVERGRSVSISSSAAFRCRSTTAGRRRRQDREPAQASPRGAARRARELRAGGNAIKSEVPPGQTGSSADDGRTGGGPERGSDGSRGGAVPGVGGIELRDRAKPLRGVAEDVSLVSVIGVVGRVRRDAPRRDGEGSAASASTI